VELAVIDPNTACAATTRNGQYLALAVSPAARALVIRRRSGRSRTSTAALTPASQDVGASISLGASSTGTLYAA